MSALPPGFVRTPHAGARMLIWLAARPLPVGSRDRYRDEFSAEVCCLGSWRQLREAASVLAGSFALSRALQKDDMNDRRDDRNLLCRIGRHAYHAVGGDNPENKQDRHKECVHCGKIKEVDMYEPSNGRYLGAYGPLA